MQFKEFCKYCDNGPNGFYDCKKITIEGIKDIKECKKTSIEGIQVAFSEEKINFYSGREIKREDMRGLIQNLKIGKSMRWDIFKTPKISPIQKILGEEVYNQLFDDIKNF